MESEINPYAAPTTASGKIKPRKSTGSLAISVVSGIGGLAFVAFTIILLRSTPPDRTAGMMFLANVPLLIGLAVSSVRSMRIAAYIAFSAGCTQIAITIAMLILVVGDAPIVIGINSAIVFACLGIAVWAWASNRRSVSAEYLTQDGA